MPLDYMVSESNGKYHVLLFKSELGKENQPLLFDRNVEEAIAEARKDSSDWML